MTTFADRVYQLGGVPVGGPVTQGHVYFVKPASGSDTASGKSPAQALKTLARAQALATANENDIVYLMSEGNAASLCTDYQSTTLDWAKDGVHLIGINSGGMVSPRSRIAWLSSAPSPAPAPLFTVSADNCRIEGIQVFSGINDADLSFCTNVTGERNTFKNCHFAGIGHATNDFAGAYSLKLAGADENLFEDCVIGLDTVARGTAANSEILFTDQATRNIFRNCIITTFAEAATHQFIIAAASSLDRWVLFENCAFINSIQSTAVAMTEALDLAATAGGMVLLRNCTIVGATDWEASTVSGIAYIDSTVSVAATSGLAVVVADS
jgi:hypothetical protein